MVEIGEIWEIELTIGTTTCLVVSKIKHANSTFDNRPDSMKWVLQVIAEDREIILHNKNIIKYGKKLA